MKHGDKLLLFKNLYLDNDFNVDVLYEALKECDALKSNYSEYMTSSPVDCDIELQRLCNADYDLCCALLTMLLREDHFCNGSFGRRHRAGQVKPVIKRIIELLS